jgi:uncharacterized protein (DUF302 family)
MIGNEALTSVKMASTSSTVASFQHERLTASPMVDVVTRLHSAIEANGLWVLHEIDPQALLRKGGYAIPGARQILFFHPRLMVRLLEADSAAILEAPLKFALLEEAAGVRLRWLAPDLMFARYRNDRLIELGSELASTCLAIADAAVARIDEVAA